MELGKTMEVKNRIKIKTFGVKIKISKESKQKKLSENN